MNNFFNSANENIIIYNGEFLSENIRDNVTRSIENLFANCKSIYDQKVYRSNHCIWFVLSKNMPEYFLVTSLKNVYAKATNKEILKNTLQTNPYILQNFAIPQSYLYLNFIHDLSSLLINTPDTTNDNFDLLG
jgi:hypothetical protein